MIKLKIKVQNHLIFALLVDYRPDIYVFLMCNTQVVISFSCFNKKEWLLDGLLLPNNYSNSMYVKFNLPGESSKCYFIETGHHVRLTFLRCPTANSLS